MSYTNRKAHEYFFGISLGENTVFWRGACRKPSESPNQYLELIKSHKIATKKWKRRLLKTSRLFSKKQRETVKFFTLYQYMNSAYCATG